MSKKKNKTIEDLLEEAMIPEGEHMYEMPENWVWVKLGSVITLISGRDISTKLCNSEGKGIPYVMGASNIVDNKLVIERWIETPTVTGVRGDILISVKGTVGKTIIQELDEVHLSRQIMALRCKETVYNNFLYLYVQTYIEKLKEAEKGIIPGISRDDILNAPFPLLPLNEQKRIAEKVERLLSKIDEAKQLIEESKETFELRRAAILGKAFRGVLETNDCNEENMLNLIGEENVLNLVKFELPLNWLVVATNVVVDVRDGTHDTPTYQDIGIPLITSKNLKNGELDFSNVKYISEDAHLEISKRSNVEVNNILFAMIGTIGNPVLIEQITRDFSIKNVALFKPNIQCIDCKYLYYYLQSPDYMNYLKNNEKGSTQKFIPLNVFRNAPLYLPPIKEQKRIAEKVESLLKKFEVEQTLLQVTLESLEYVKYSVLSKAFRGELGTNDPRDENVIELLKEVLQDK